MQTRILIAGLAAATLTVSTSAATVFFTESFETPAVTGNEVAGDLSPGAVTLDNSATAAGTANVIGGVARVVDGNSAGLDVAATEGGQAVVYGFGGAIGTSLTWTIAGANTLTNGDTLTISYDVASIFAPATGETWDVVFAGGAVGTSSASLSGGDTVDQWRTDTFNLLVTDSTQATTLQIVATRASSALDDFALDNIAVETSGTFIPEPSSLALLGLGGLLIARRRRG